jgi:xylulokinase
MNTLIGIDLGTTGLKVSLWEESGRLLGAEYREYPILAQQPGFAEQEPQAWWDGLVSACRALVSRFPQEAGATVGIGICGQMHTQVYLDEHDQVLRPAITWMDQRASAIVERINSDPSSKTLVLAETHNLATTTYTAPQILWVKENQPEVWRRTRRVLVAKDYIKYRLTGRAVTDYAEATGTLLFDVVRRRWSEEMFRFFDIPAHYLPEVLPSDEIIGKITPQAAQLTGLKAGTPVANGSADCSAAALGAGMVRPGQVTLIIGTAGVVAVCSDRPLEDRQHRTLCWHYALRDRWLLLGITQTAGESLHWFKNAFEAGETAAASGDIFAQYSQEADTVPDGAGGLIFLPYLNGERTPYWDPNARGVFFGINLATEKAHFIKAIMEGVSFALRNNIETIESLGIHIDEIRAVGGGLKSQAWLQALGKITCKPVATIGVPDTANLGNILVCGKALGLYPDYQQAVERMVTIDRRVSYESPTPVYERQYAIFLELYEQLKGLYRRSALGNGA